MKTEQRLILALGLSFLIIAVYPYVLKTFFPSLAPHASKVEAPSTPIEKKTEYPSSPLNGPSLRAPQFSTNLEDLHLGPYDLKISPAGALIQHLDLPHFKSGVKESNTLINAQDGPGAFQVWVAGFEPASSVGMFTEKIRPGEKYGVVSYQEDLDSKIRLEKKFDFLSTKNAFRFTLTLTNLTDQRITTHYELSSQLYFTEKNGYDANFVEFNLLTPEKIFSKKVGKLKKEPYLHQGGADWVALSRKYFSIVLAPDNNVPVEEVRAREAAPDTMEAILKTKSFDLPAKGQITHEYLVYAGPNAYDDLKSFGLGFQKILSKGFFGPLKVGMLLVLHWCYRWIPNYGVAIILLTIFVKILFAPLTHISFESMRRMQALQPKIKALQNTYKNDPQRMQKELMGLYKKNKVNPLGGCLPMLLQMPIFIALYQVLSQAVELRGASFFGWIHDLSQPDRLFTLPFSAPLIGNAINVLPLIMIGTMLWQQRLNPSSGMDPQQEKMMAFMPIVFGFVFYNLPSGLVIYWTLSNLLTIIHQLLIKRIPFHLHPDTI